jgi:predicted ATPase/DNA-binding SARP family transcriptional activator
MSRDIHPGFTNDGQVAGLRFGVLGPLEVWRDGEPVPVPAGRRRAVLACLLVHAGRPVAADVLVEAGWGAEVPAEPRAALNTVLSRLRALLGEHAVRSGPAGYALDVPGEAVDARQFEALRARAASLPPEEAGRILKRALGLWRGSAYAEFADRDFAAVEAQRLDLLRLDTIEARAALCLDGGDAEAAAADLEPVLAEQPFREHALQLLMTALYRTGRATEALARYRGYRVMLAGELGLDPSPALQDLEMRILGHDLPAPRARASVAGSPTWLDTSTAFIGRDAALADLVEAAAASRVVTVTGAGGVGKTRLVAQALPLLSAHLGVPVTVVELAPVQSGQVDAAVADALGLSSRAGAVRAGVVEYLSICDGVLVLDNCEHLLGDAAALAAAIVHRCPRIRVVATSRRRLGIPSERVLPLEPLPVPGAGEGAARLEVTAAVRLLTDRVRRVRPSFAVTDENLAAVADICRQLDGLPLALELAAPRVAALGPAPVRDRLRRSPTLLDEPDGRSAGLRGVVDWSYRLLPAGQRRLLALLSVFAGDFDLNAVQGVASALGAWDDGRAVAEPLAELVESSLLSAYDDGGQVRYRMLAIVRAFAAKRLADSGQAQEAHLAHAAWVRRLVEQAATEHTGARSVTAFARLKRNRANIDSAVRWALEAGHLRVAGAITGSLQLCTHSTQELELDELVVAVAEQCARLPDPGPALAVAAGGYTLAYRGELGRSRKLAQAALPLAATPQERFLACLALGVATLYAGEHEESARWWREIAAMENLPLAYRAEGHISLALLACYHGDLHAGQQQAALALAATEAAGAAADHAFALYAAGEIAVVADMEDGARILGEAAAAADRAGAGHVSRVARLAQLAALVRLARHDDALGLAIPLLHDEHRAAAWPQLWTTIRIVAELLAARGYDQDAMFLLAAADTAESSPPVTGDDVRRYQQLASDLRERLGPEHAAQITALARGIPRAQVLHKTLTLLGKQAN